MVPYGLPRPARLSRLRRALTVLALAGAVAATAVVPAAAAPRSPHSATQDALDAITRAGTPGVLARADRGGEVWYGTSGVADRRTGRPRLPQDRFRIASLTKTFTATVLLQHTSGLYDYLDDAALRAKYTGTAFFTHRYDGATPEQLVRTALAQEPVFDSPGDDWDYSNTNYILAGMVIEKATGHGYASEVKRRIITPLGLRGTTLPGTSPRLPGPHGRHYSTLFVDGPEARAYDATEFNPSVAGAAGEIISTARDLNVFYRALLRGELLPPAQQKEMFTGRDLGATGRTAWGSGHRSSRRAA